MKGIRSLYDGLRYTALLCAIFVSFALIHQKIKFKKMQIKKFKNPTLPLTRSMPITHRLRGAAIYRAADHAYGAYVHTTV